MDDRELPSILSDDEQSALERPGYRRRAQALSELQNLVTVLAGSPDGIDEIAARIRAMDKSSANRTLAIIGEAARHLSELSSVDDDSYRELRLEQVEEVHPEPDIEEVKQPETPAVLVGGMSFEQPASEWEEVAPRDPADSESEVEAEPQEEVVTKPVRRISGIDEQLRHERSQQVRTIMDDAQHLIEEVLKKNGRDHIDYASAKVNSFLKQLRGLNVPVNFNANEFGDAQVYGLMQLYAREAFRTEPEAVAVNIACAWGSLLGIGPSDMVPVRARTKVNGQTFVNDVNNSRVSVTNKVAYALLAGATVSTTHVPVWNIMPSSESELAPRKIMKVVIGTDGTPILI